MRPDRDKPLAAAADPDRHAQSRQEIRDAVFKLAESTRFDDASVLVFRYNGLANEAAAA